MKPNITHQLKDIKGAIFDLDGTLLESMGIWVDIDKKFLANRGIIMPKDYVDAINPLGFRDAALYTIKRFNLDEQPEALVAEWDNLAKDAYEHDVQLKPFAREFLLKLKANGTKLGIATALSKSLFVKTLKNNGILELFDALTSVDEVTRGKGFPDIYLATSKKLDLEAGQCAVFEDIYLGIKGANDGGFLSVGVYDEFSNFEKDKIEQSADIYLHSFEEVTANWL